MSCITLASLLALSTQDVQAHEPEATASSVIVRSGHVQVQVHVDLLAWLQRLGPTSGEPVPVLALVDPTAFDALLDQARAQLSRTTLQVDGASRPLRITRFPDTVSVRELALTWIQAQTVDPQYHAEATVLTLEAQLDTRPARLSVSLPETLGTVHFTLTEPASALVPPGGRATFTLPPPT